MIFVLVCFYLLLIFRVDIYSAFVNKKTVTCQNYEFITVRIYLIFALLGRMVCGRTVCGLDIYDGLVHLKHNGQNLSYHKIT
jgi:hypothetical protein